MSTRVASCGCIHRDDGSRVVWCCKHAERADLRRGRRLKVDPDLQALATARQIVLDEMRRNRDSGGWHRKAVDEALGHVLSRIDFRLRLAESWSDRR